MSKKITVGTSKIYSVSANPSGSLASSAGDLALSSEGIIYINQGGLLWQTVSGDLGSFNGWSGSDLDACIAAAGSNLAAGDILLDTSFNAYYTILLGGNEGTQFLPMQVPISTTSPKFNLDNTDIMIQGVDPVAAGISGWNNTSAAGTPTYTVTDGVLTLAADGSGDTARINFDDGRALGTPALFIIDDLSATCQAGTLTQFPQIQFRSDGSTRYLGLRPGGNTASDVWGIAEAGTNLDIAGATIGTPHRLEIYCDYTNQSVRVRVDGGTWQTFSVTMPTVSSSTSFVALASYNGGTQSLSFSKLFVGIAF